MYDSLEFDGTDAAHPAWWRGQDHAVKAMCRQITEILDGKGVAGTCSEPWETVRKRVASLVVSRNRGTYLTPHDLRRLDWACAPIGKRFRECPYLVGSVLTRDDYRDIDIRLILPDDQLIAMTGGDREIHWLMNAAFTALIESMVRMSKPIDFQFQSASEAIKEEGPRNPLGMR